MMAYITINGGEKRLVLITAAEYDTLNDGDVPDELVAELYTRPEQTIPEYELNSN